MSDYQFKCPKCKKYTYTTSSDDYYPDVGAFLKCMKCHNKFKVKFVCLNCEVEEITGEKT